MPLTLVIMNRVGQQPSLLTKLVILEKSSFKTQFTILQGGHLYVSHCDSRRVKTPISKFSLEIRPIRRTSTLESKLNPDVVSG
jgi:hypothetical protein